MELKYILKKQNQPNKQKKPLKTTKPWENNTLLHPNLKLVWIIKLFSLNYTNQFRCNKEPLLH